MRFGDRQDGRREHGDSRRPRGYTFTVRNRGRAIARNYLLCDRIPRRAKFVRANSKLHQVRRQRCLFVPRLKPGARERFHISLRVDSKTPSGNLDNIADIIRRHGRACYPRVKTPRGNGAHASALHRIGT